MRPDQEAFFEAFYRENFNKLKYQAYPYLNQLDQCEVAAQEAFLIAHDNIGTLMDHENPYGWMVETVKNVAKNMKRKQDRYLRLCQEVETLAQRFNPSAPDPLRLDFICASIVKEEEYVLFRSITYGIKSYTEMAEELGISVPACRKRVQRTGERLRNALSEGGNP